MTLDDRLSGDCSCLSAYLHHALVLCVALGARLRYHDYSRGITLSSVPDTRRSAEGHSPHRSSKLTLLRCTCDSIGVACQSARLRRAPELCVALGYVMSSPLGSSMSRSHAAWGSALLRALRLLIALNARLEYLTLACGHDALRSAETAIVSRLIYIAFSCCE